MSTASRESRPRAFPSWAGRGDINAFFGLMLDNIGDMILMASLLVGVFGFPAEFVLTRMIPGTAVGVLVGDPSTRGWPSGWRVGPGART